MYNHVSKTKYSMSFYGMKCYIRVEQPLNYECSINVLLRLGFSENRRHYKAQ